MPRGLVGRIGGGIVSQALSMASNVVMVLGMARLLDERSFGQFALAYGLLQIGIGIARSSVTDVVAAHVGGDSASVAAFARPALLSGTLRLLVVAGVVFVVSLWIFDGLHEFGVLLSVAALPAGVHEFQRQLGFASLRAWSSALLDVGWVVTSGVVLIAVGVATGSVGGRLLLTSWIVGAAVSCLLGLRNFGWLSSDGGGREQLDSLRSDQLAYAGEFAVSRGTPEVLAWALALVGGVELAGSFRIAQTLLGPTSVVLGGFRGTLAAELRRSSLDGRSLMRSAVAAGAVLFAVPIVYLVVLFLVPERLGENLVGAQWAAAMTVVPYLALRRSLAASSIAPFLALRILGAGRSSTGLRVAESLITVATIVGAAILVGSEGALTGFVVAGVVTSAMWWNQLKRRSGSYRIPHPRMTS